MYKVFFITFGCKVNQYETDSLRSEFASQGFAEADSAENADVIIVNSCTVTASGDSKSLYSVRKMRKTAPEAVIALTGCLPQTAPDIAEKIPEADIITGTKDRKSLPLLVKSVLAERKQIVAVTGYGKDDEFELTEYNGAEDKTRAFVKIQDGCNQFCSYCIIPFARGRCRSKPIEDIRSEIQAIAESGKKEVVLSGINLAFYGREFGLDLADAVEVCAEIKGIERIRLGSLEPEMMSDRLLERLSAVPQFCPQFHLSLQSGCSKTLKDMNRRYNADEYYELAQRIRKIFPECSFTTDVMVGFPNETEEDFNNSLAFVEKMQFAKVHVFRYSRRKGTKADKMSGQIPENVKTERWRRMTETASRCREKYLSSLVGKTVPVLFERENSEDFYHGYAPDYTLIKISRKKAKKSLRNFIFYVTIKEYSSDCCYGESELIK